MESQHRKKENSGEYLKERMEQQHTREKEMREEIEILITQCKDLQGKLKSKEEQYVKQAGSIEQLEIVIQQKEAETQKREGYLARVLQQLDAKKNELRSAQLKIRQISKTIVADLNKKLEERENEMKLMKEMIKGHHMEIETKMKDITRLNKKIKTRKI